MQKVGFVGWRGMVGSVLLQRMKEEKDFSVIKSFFFSTSQQGESAPDFSNTFKTLLDANRIDELIEMDIIISCQGGDYTEKIHPQLRAHMWKGIWIDASSTLRLNDDSLIALDPLNHESMVKALNRGVVDFSGGNCTVSLMLMALGGLFKSNHIEWMSSMTYQAASGAGAKHMIELMDQMSFQTDTYKEIRSNNPSAGALEIEQAIAKSMKDTQFPQKEFGFPLNLSLLPWIDSQIGIGHSKEEWKAQVEANKILETKDIIPIDGTCVRIGAMRCHAQAFTIKLNKDIPLETIEELIGEHNEWVELIPNEPELSQQKLTPIYTSGTLKIPIGRLRKMTIGEKYLNAFTIGDQLLWGAAEPLRRTLRIVIS